MQVQARSLKLVYNQGMSLECFYPAFQFGSYIILDEISVFIIRIDCTWKSITFEYDKLCYGFLSD